MNLIDEKITHKVFGKGKIVDQDETIITIDFKEDTKSFIYPDAFEKFLTLTDQETNSSLQEVLTKQKEEEEALLKKREEEKALRAAEQERKELLRDYKIHESSQIVFWLDEEEQQNVFTDWQVSTGEVQSGKNEGQPNKVTRVRPNSAALLTARASNQEETDRKILGLFMVNESFVGNLNENGIVPAHQDYRIELTEQEAEKMLFWNYYLNKSYPHRTTWNSGKFRYFDNIWTAQILTDILALKTEENEIKQVQDFLEYFCKMNVIDIDSIPAPEGALKQ